MDSETGTIRPRKMPSNIPEITTPKDRKTIFHERHHSPKTLLPINTLKRISVGVLKRAPSRVVEINVPTGSMPPQHILDVTNLLFLNPYIVTLKIRA
jgi:hypothetical protein